MRCAQVTIEGMELYDAVHWTVHIEHSETVAVNNCNIWGDPLIPNSAGIVIDGSKRMYLGENTISTADNAITVRTPQGKNRTQQPPSLCSCCCLTELPACQANARQSRLVASGQFWLTAPLYILVCVV